MDMHWKVPDVARLGSKKLLEGPSTLSYEELSKRCAQLQVFLHRSGLKPGDRVGVATTHDSEAAALIVSLFQLRFPVAMIDTGAKASEVAEILQRLNLSALFVDQELFENWKMVASVSAVPNVFRMKKGRKKLLNRLLGNRSEEPEKFYPESLPDDSLPSVDWRSFPVEDSPALLLCTSGTTGLPKILQLAYTNLVAAAKTTSTKLQLDSNSRVLNLLPLTHYDGVISGLFTAFFTSATQVRPGAFTLSLLPDIFDAIYAYGITHLLLTPSILALMMRLKEEIKSAFASDDFQFVISVAATLPPKLWSDFEQLTGKKIVNVYGLSETGNNLFAGPDPGSHHVGAIGKPVDCRALIVNEKGEKLPPGETGELLLQADSITSGYLNEPVQAVDVDGSSWFATGDLAVCDEAGVFWLAGRKKNIIIVGGRNVYPDEINNALMSHPFVTEAATIGANDEMWGERVVSFVVSSQALAAEDLLAHAGKLLADYKIPREIRFVSELPRGRSGKVLLNELVRRFNSEEFESQKTAGEDVAEQILRLASESFRVPRSELTPDTAPRTCSRWDSVAHMDLVVNLEKTFGIELHPREVIRITTLEHAVRIVRDKLAAK